MIFLASAISSSTASCDALIAAALICVTACNSGELVEAGVPGDGAAGAAASAGWLINAGRSLRRLIRHRHRHPGILNSPRSIVAGTERQTNSELKDAETARRQAAAPIMPIALDMHLRIFQDLITGSHCQRGETDAAIQ
jgi:hypothetical protein